MNPPRAGSARGDFVSGISAKSAKFATKKKRKFLRPSRALWFVIETQE
jgi:hypothetical protein